jgi:hypothetical protein
MSAKTAEQGVVEACSFCMKPKTEVRKLVAGAGVYICDECVDLCVQLVAGPSDGSPPELGSWDRVDDVEKVLDHLPRVAAVGGQAEETLTHWVRRARELGATWARIGGALGMTRQSAWGRFSGEE